MVKLHFKRVLFFTILGIVIAVVVGLFSPVVYEARTELLFGAADARRVAGGSLDPVDQILELGSQGSIETELGIIKSESTFAQALEATYRDTGDSSLIRDYEDLFLMYDVRGQELSRVAQVRVRAYSRENAIAIADQIGRVYNDLRRSVTQKSFFEAQTYLDSQVRSVAVDLKAAEDRLERFKIEKGFVNFEVLTTEKARYQQSLIQQLDKAQADLEATIEAIGRQKVKMATLPETRIQSVVENKSAVVAKIEEQIAEYQRQKVEALRIYRPDSERIKDLDAVIKEWEKKLLDERAKNLMTVTGQQTMPDPVRAQIELAVAGNEIQVTSLRSQIAAIERELAQEDALQKDLPRDEITLQRLFRELQIVDAKYRRLKTQAEDLKDRAETVRVSAQVISPARAAPRPVAPDYWKLGFIGLLSGLCLGLVYTFVVDAMRLRVSTSSQLADLTGLPVVATLPKLPGRSENRLLSALPDPDSKPVEGFRFMAFSSVAKFESFPRVLMFTSAQGADATLSATQYALAVAKTGLRTLLVDADLRTSTVTGIFDASKNSGVSDVLNRSLLPSDQTDLVLSTQHENLLLMPAGTEKGSSLADFQTAHIVGLLEMLKVRADIVVIDTPPCDILSDASRLVKHVDEVFLVVSARATHYRQVPQAYDILSKSGAKDVSLILIEASATEEAFSETGGSISG